MARDSSDLTWVVMAKRPEPGRVNTRLVDGRGIDADAAAALGHAMLGCIVDRLVERGPVVLAATPDGCGPELARSVGHPDLQTVDQGPGDLGDRLERVWRALEGSRPVAFLGMDSPDVPAAHLDALAAGIDDADVLVGPTPDGGYWTIAAATHRPRVVRGIDWGSGSVYDQTCERARDAGLSILELPAWHDVDRPADLAALADRLDRHSRAGAAADRADEALRRLADRLQEILKFDRRVPRDSTP